MGEDVAAGFVRYVKDVAVIEAVAPWEGARSDYPAPGTLWGTANEAAEFEAVTVVTVLDARPPTEPKVVIRRLINGKADPKRGPEAMFLRLFRHQYVSMVALIQRDTAARGAVEGVSDEAE
jgi:hypothetical protein